MTNPNATHITIVLDSSGSMNIIKKDTIGGINEFITKQKLVDGKCTFTRVEFSSGNRNHHKSARVTRDKVGFLSPRVTWVPPYGAPSSPFIWGQTPALPVVYTSNSSCNVVMGLGIALPINNNMVPGLLPEGYVAPATVMHNTNPLRTTSEYATVENCIDINKAELLTEDSYVPSGGTPLLDSIGRAIYETGEVLAMMPEAERPDKVLFVILTDGEENASHEYSKEDIKAVIEHQTNVYAWDFLFLGANMDAVAVGTSYGINGMRSANFAATSAGMGGTTSVLNEKVATYRACTSKVDATATLGYSTADRTKNMGGA